MPTHKVIDTFPHFLLFWNKFKNEPIENQIDGWVSHYMSRWPELLDKQLGSWSEESMDWR